MAKATYYKKGNIAYLDMLFMSSWDQRWKSIEDQIFHKHPTLAWMLERKNTNMLGEGGEQFIAPLLVEENPNGGWINEEEGVSMDDFDPDAGATYWAKTLAYGTRWPRYQQRVNRGSNKKYSIIEHKEEVTIKSVKNLLAQAVYSGSGGASKQPEGLSRLIPPTVPASQSVSIGGLSPSTNAWWRTQGTDMSGSPATTNLESEMIDMHDTIELETGTPNVIFTHKDVKQIYEKNAMSFLTVDAKTKVGDATFEMVKFKSLPIIFDKFAPSGELRMVTNAGILWCVDPEFYMKWTDSKEAVNLPITKFRQLVTVCAMARIAARSHGCIFNISANGD